MISAGLTEVLATKEDVSIFVKRANFISTRAERPSAWVGNSHRLHAALTVQIIQTRSIYDFCVRNRNYGLGYWVLGPLG